MTPLILAAKQKHQDLMEYLVVNAKADVNIRAEKVEFTVPCNTQYTIMYNMYTVHYTGGSQGGAEGAWAPPS